MTDESPGPASESRRAFIKNGTLAATALTIGAGATATTATAADNETAILSASDYYPDVDFDILTQFVTGTRNNFLEQYDEDGAIFADPSDWEVYVIRIDIGESEGELGHLILDVDDDEPDVEPGDTGTMDEIASFRSPERYLVETEVDL